MPVVLVLAAVTLVVWLFAGQTAGYALARAISVLVISCPCALDWQHPLPSWWAAAWAPSTEFLFKTAVSLEETGKVETVVLDKTGTITSGHPQVTDLLPAEGVSQQQLLGYAFALEAKSEHPLARAVLEKAKEWKLTPAEVQAFEALPGNGLFAELEGKALVGGNARFLSSRMEVSDEWKRAGETLANAGKKRRFISHWTANCWGLWRLPIP